MTAQQVSASLIVATCKISTPLMASVAWVSFQHVAMSALHISSLHQEFRVALVVTSCSRAAFTSPCSQDTSSGRSVGLAPGGAQDCGQGEILAASNMACREGHWLTQTMPGMCSSITSAGDAHEEVAIRWGMAEPVPSRPSGSSALVEGRAPKATEGSFLLGMLCWGVLCWGVRAEVTGGVCCNCSKAPWRCWLRTTVMSCGGLMAGRGWYQCGVGSLGFCAA